MSPVMTQAPFSLDHAPRITIRMRSHRVPYGSSTSFTLNVQAKPELEVNWFHNGKGINQSCKYHMTNISGVLTLRIINCVTEDSGTYRVVCKNAKGDTSDYATLDVAGEEYAAFSSLRKDEDPPSSHLPEMTRTESTTVTEKFECDVDGEPAPLITWLHEGAVIGSSARHHVTSTQYKSHLEISAVEKADAGSYTVLVENAAGKLEAHFTLNIHKSKFAKEVVASPRVTSPEAKSPLNVNEGQNVKFTCEILGEPSPEVEWLKDNRSVSIFLQKLTYHYLVSQISLTSNIRLSHSKNVFNLDICKATIADSGKYTIKATNQFGQCSLTCWCV
uniref:Ig-like domain-containing protein n=1 Tax=Mola mola TaxID=94237 RepID=A0A3Q3X935_MOLML